MEKTLSIFVDESGDFGSYSKHNPYYLLSLVFHDQSYDIKNDIKKLDAELDNLKFEKHLIHTEPLIRREPPYTNMFPNERRTILTKLYYFMLKTNIKHKTFIYSKLKFNNMFELQSQMSKDLSFFLQNNKFIHSFDKVILYYDNGQNEITKILNVAMSICFSNHDVRNINPYDYKLFQVADLVCSLELTNEKFKTRNLTISEKYIFHSKSDFKKDFYKNFSKNSLN